VSNTYHIQVFQQRPAAERSSPTSAASLAAVPPGTSAASLAAAKAIAPVTWGFTAPDGQFVTREWTPSAHDLAMDGFLGFLGPSSSSQMPPTPVQVCSYSSSSSSSSSDDDDYDELY
jgi:hypothetical protein